MKVRSICRRLWTRSRIRGAVATVTWSRKRVRIHPSVRIDVPTGGLRAERGVKLSERCRLIAPLGSIIDLAREVWIAEDCLIEAAGTIRIGANSTIQRRTSLVGSVEIGQNCILAPNIFISSGAHPIRRWPYLSIRDQERLMAEFGEPLPDSPVVVGDDCWLGVNVVVSPGVSIGQGAVVGANSVVTKNVPPYAVVAGVPARLISRRLVWSPPASLDFTDPASIPYLGGADTSVAQGKELTALATSNTILHLANVDPPLDMMLEIEVLRPTTLGIDAATHDLSTIGPESIAVPSTCGGPIRVNASRGTVRLIALRSLGESIPMRAEDRADSR